MLKFKALFTKSSIDALPKRNISLTSLVQRRKPPVEEYKNNGMNTRKKTADPFDRFFSYAML